MRRRRAGIVRVLATMITIVILVRVSDASFAFVFERSVC